MCSDHIHVTFVVHSFLLFDVKISSCLTKIHGNLEKLPKPIKDWLKYSALLKKSEGFLFLYTCLQYFLIMQLKKINNNLLIS